MKKLLWGLFSSFLVTVSCEAFTQSGNVQDLKLHVKQLEKNPGYQKDTTYINTLNQLAYIYADNYPDSAISMLSSYAQKNELHSYYKGAIEAKKIIGNAYQTKGDFGTALKYYDESYQLAQKHNQETLKPGILNNIGLCYLNQGNYTAALSSFYEALKRAERNGDKYVIGRTLNNIAIIHFYQGKMAEAEADYRKMLKLSEALRDTAGIVLAYSNIGEVNYETNQLSKALVNLNTAYRLAVESRNIEMQVASTKNLGNAYYKMDSFSRSIQFFDSAQHLAMRVGQKPQVCKALIGLAKAKQQLGKSNQALADGLAAVHLAEEMGQTSLLRDANEIVSTVYESIGNGTMALQHYKLFKLYADSLRNVEGERLATRLQAEFDFSKKELEFQRKSLQQQWLLFSALSGFFILLVIVWMVNQNRQRAKRSNIILQQKNEIIHQQKTVAEKALVDLKAAQQQLIQHEKMASLGALTAGIAHEIQNPLNFVNNFSALNKDLLNEMQQEIVNKNFVEVQLLAADIDANEAKIIHHGKRAEAIVKSMLLHSNQTSGEKAPTNINLLVEEYLRLSYHGFKAKNAAFQATLHTDFDQSIEAMPIAPQEISRVLLNVFNNAFYAVNEKKKKGNGTYEPIISVRTGREEGRIRIFIKDNGIGMPQQIAEKVFQPFFTTKPTGDGTGLGLSLSYDIITKGHGGMLSVQSEEGEGAAFVIDLPE